MALSTQTRARPKITVQVTLKDKTWRILFPAAASQVRSWAKHTLLAAKADGNCEVAIVLADDAFIRPLNREYRGKDKPTNVLSFPQTDGHIEFGDEPVMLGDIILARETVEREAQEQGKHITQHVAHLTVHGCLHLLGYDHETVADAKKMETLEKNILLHLGFPDPYIIKN